MNLRNFFDDDVKKSLLCGALVGTLVLAGSLAWRSLDGAPAAAPASTALAQRQLDLAGVSVAPDALRLVRWVVDSADNGTRPFVVLDKRQAQLLVFEAEGRLIGATPVLLGHAHGDDTVPGIGSRPVESVRPEERTTPAGRYIAELGRNTLGEEVVWVDYDAAVSLHRVRLSDPTERRAERLASASVADNRISYGCINLPVAFFEQVLWPTMRRQPGIVYVLPEHKKLEQVFPGLDARRAV